MSDAKEYLTGGVIRLHNLEEEGLLKSAALALKDFNLHENTDYQLVKIEEASGRVVSGLVFYITFQAKIPNGQLELFQADVYNSFSDQEVLRVMIIRTDCTWIPGTLSEPTTKQGSDLIKYGSSVVSYFRKFFF